MGPTGRALARSHGAAWITGLDARRDGADVVFVRRQVPQNHFRGWHGDSSDRLAVIDGLSFWSRGPLSTTPDNNHRRTDRNINCRDGTVTDHQRSGAGPDAHVAG